jgi:hypothetical protein
VGSDRPHRRGYGFGHLSEQGKSINVKKLWTCQKMLALTEIVWYNNSDSKIHTRSFIRSRIGRAHSVVEKTEGGHKNVSNFH